MKPSNAIAMEIASLRSNDGDLDIQIETLQERKAQIASTIAELEPHATWEEEVPPAQDPSDIEEPTP